ncbi:MAG: RDD family protein [Deltaproteobacteria bacterium]|nr:RDD family protein [Deltaproteobacteria bacterium]
MSCPRCNSSSEPADTTCRSCSALIAAVPVPFFRGADEWRNPEAPDFPQARVAEIARDADLAGRFADPSFDFSAESAAIADAPPPAEAWHVTAPPLVERTEPAPPMAPALVVEETLPRIEKLEVEPARPDAPPAEIAPAIVHAALAPPWRRLAAGLVDAMPLAGSLMLMMLLFEHDLEVGRAPLVPTSLHELARVFLSLGMRGWIVLAVVCAVSVVYHSFCIAYMRATVGDLLFGIRWLTQQGDPPRLGRAVTRAVLAVPSWLLAMAGVWYVLLSRTRRTLYDTLSGCYPVLRSS